MKSDDNPEASQTDSDNDLTADAPHKLRFERMQGVGRSKGIRRKKRKSESRQVQKVQKQKKRIVKTQLLLMVGLAILVIGLFLTFWLIPRIKRTASNSSIAGKTPPSTEVKTKVISQFPAPTAEESLALVKQALAIRDPDKIAGYFRLDDASPEAVVDFLQGLDAKEGEIDGLRWLSSIGTTEIALEGVLVKFKGQEALRSRLALLTHDSAGKWRIDFDALARTVNPSWADLLEKQAPVGVVRVFVRKDTYYNGLFDDQKWLCYGLGSPDLEEPLRAYCKIGSPQSTALDWMLSKGAKISRATLEIRRVEGAESRQFEISKVLAEDWVMGPSPFEDRFK